MSLSFAEITLNSLTVHTVGSGCLAAKYFLKLPLSSSLSFSLCCLAFLFAEPDGCYHTAIF
jgi:hypothetical protein